LRKDGQFQRFVYCVYIICNNYISFVSYLPVAYDLFTSEGNYPSSDISKYKLSSDHQSSDHQSSDINAVIFSI